jgi:hypothetical protein
MRGSRYMLMGHYIISTLMPQQKKIFFEKTRRSAQSSAEKKIDTALLLW